MAQNTGRIARLRGGLNPTPATAVYEASELLDDKTCGPVRSDRRQRLRQTSRERAGRPTPAAVTSNCEGGPNCRGTLVAIYPSRNPERRRTTDCAKPNRPKCSRAKGGERDPRARSGIPGVEGKRPGKATSAQHSTSLQVDRSTRGRPRSRVAPDRRAASRSTPEVFTPLLPTRLRSLEAQSMAHACTRSDHYNPRVPRRTAAGSAVALHDTGELTARRQADHRGRLALQQRRPGPGAARDVLRMQVEHGGQPASKRWATTSAPTTRKKRLRRDAHDEVG